MARTDDSPALIERLPNGLRVAWRQARGVAECMGVAIMAGSRDERPDEHGLAHFVEHTIFKGTTRRHSRHVINRMEAVGGELNAYTSKEETFVYTVAPAGNTARAVELLADLVMNPRFPVDELDREREVVEDEISSYLDSPSEAVCDDFEDIMFQGSSLGHNILGTRESLEGLDSAKCLEWVRRNYTASRMVFFYTGPAPHGRVMHLVERYFASLPTGGEPLGRIVPPVNARFNISRSIGSHQAHTLAGTRLPVITDDRRYDLALCNNILGGPGMNSRLNIALRERRGLVYTVDSSLTSMSDCGMFTVYYGCDDCHVDLCSSLVAEELSRLADAELTERQLTAARRQYMGQVMLSSASTESSALALGRCVLRDMSYPTNARLAAILDDITPARLREAAELIASPGISSLTFMQ